MITRRALDLIVSHESIARHPYWPGGESGVTLGIGYDLAHHSLAELNADWIESGRIVCSDLASQALLQSAVGKRGTVAALLAPRLAGCVVEEEDAREVFEEESLPKYEALTRRAFPGVERLPPDAYGALVSLVFNRGADMGTEGEDSWERRREMRDISSYRGTQ